MQQDLQYLSVREIAEKYHVSARTIYELLWAGQLEGAVRIGDAVRIPADALAKLPAYKRQRKGGGDDS
jgi:excisionase family DNA binding protein